MSTGVRLKHEVVREVPMTKSQGVEYDASLIDNVSHRFERQNE